MSITGNGTAGRLGLRSLWSRGARLTGLILAGWGGIVTLAYHLADGRLQLCQGADSYTAEMNCRVRVTTVRDDILVNGLTVALAFMLVAGFLRLRQQNMGRLWDRDPTNSPPPAVLTVSSYQAPRPDRSAWRYIARKTPIDFLVWVLSCFFVGAVIFLVAQFTELGAASKRSAGSEVSQSWESAPLLAPNEAVGPIEAETTTAGGHSRVDSNEETSSRTSPFDDIPFSGTDDSEDSQQQLDERAALVEAGE